MLPHETVVRMRLQICEAPMHPSKVISPGGKQAKYPVAASVFTKVNLQGIGCEISSMVDNFGCVMGQVMGTKLSRFVNYHKRFGIANIILYGLLNIISLYVTIFFASLFLPKLS